MATFFHKFKKPCFEPIFGPFSEILRQKNFFPKIQFCHTQLHLGFQHHAKIQKKLMIQLQENAQTEGRIGRTHLFYKTLPATAGSPIKDDSHQNVRLSKEMTIHFWFVQTRFNSDQGFSFKKSPNLPLYYKLIYQDTVYITIKQILI